MKTFLLLLIAYLLGSIPTGLWIGKIFYRTDIRNHGSGNTGTTNTFRILDWKAGSITFIIDLLKGTLAVLLAFAFGSVISPLIVGFFAILGHTFPIFTKFKGGKAVATSGGVLLGFAPVFLLYLFILFVIILLLSSMISFTSVAVAIIAVFSVLIFPMFGFILKDYNILFTLMILIMALVIIIRHKDNIKRIKNKHENLIPFGLNLTRQKRK